MCMSYPKFVCIVFVLFEVSLKYVCTIESFSMMYLSCTKFVSNVLSLIMSLMCLSYLKFLYDLFVLFKVCPLQSFSMIYLSYSGLSLMCLSYSLWFICPILYDLFVLFKVCFNVFVISEVFLWYICPIQSFL